MTARRVARFIGMMVLASAAWAPGVAAEPTPGYVTIQRAFLREDFEMVASLASTFIVNYPNEPEATTVWLWLTLSLDRLGRAQEALEELDRLKATLAPGHALWPELVFWEGDISRRALQILRAKLAYQRLLERYPESTWAAQAQFGLGLIYVQQQACESAVQHLHEVALRRPGTAIARDALLFEGLCELRLGHFTEALAIFEPLLRQLQDPDVMAQAQLYLGESFSGLGRFEEAVAAYRRAADVAPRSTWAWRAQFGLGWALYQLNRCEESLGVFDTYLAQAPSQGWTASTMSSPGFLRGQAVVDYQVEALFAQGSCLIRLGHESRAIARFEQILARDPEHPLAVEGGLVIAEVYRRQERFLEAKAALHELLRRPLDVNTRAQINLRLGRIALDQGNPAQASTVFEAARESPDSSIQQAALSGLGDVQVFLGELVSAKHFYDKAIQRSPESSAATYAAYQIGRIHLQAGEFEEAGKQFRQIAEGATAEPAWADEARLALVLVHLNQGNTTLARALLANLREQHPTGAIAGRATYYEALLAFDEGDEQRAERLCQEALARAPKTDEALDARLLLADLLASRTSARDAMDWLWEAYLASGVSVRHRAKLAKHLGELARSEQDYAEAIYWYQEAMRLLPAMGGEVLYRIASCYEEGGDIELALVWYQRIEQRPWRIRAALAIAKVLERQSRLTEAAGLYTWLASLPIPEAKVAQERLAQLHGATDDKE